jgi:peroxiredoxin
MAGMVLLENRDVTLGTACPDFDLPTVDGRRFARRDATGKAALVVLFICNHCPYVQAVEDRYVALAHEYGPQGVQFVGVCANDPEGYPEDAPPRLLERWREKRYGFPYCVDATQAVARAFDAVCTPDIFVYDADLRLAYHGRIDDNWKEPEKVTRHELAAALDALVAGRRPSDDQRHSIGCSIKWKDAS